MVKGRSSDKWCVRAGKCVMERALDGVAEVLAKRAAEAPMGSVVVGMRRLVRLIGEGVLLVRRKSLCCAGLGRGDLVGSLASKRLLLSVWWLVVLQVFASCLVMFSMCSALGG